MLQFILTRKVLPTIIPGQYMPSQESNMPTQTRVGNRARSAKGTNSLRERQLEGRIFLEPSSRQDHSPSPQHLESLLLSLAKLFPLLAREASTVARTQTLHRRSMHSSVSSATEDVKNPLFRRAAGALKMRMPSNSYSDRLLVSCQS
jgi:hypothetical protein